MYLLDFLCSGIQLYLLLIPYLCFISFLLYLDFYVLGDDALISYGVIHANQTSMRLEQRVRLARHETGSSSQVKYFTDCSKAVLVH